MLNKNYIIAMLMMLFISNTHAALVTFNANGTVEGASAGNDFTLNVSDPISASGAFDDAGFTGSGLEIFSTSLSLSVGSVNFTDADNSGLTEIAFQDGVFLGFNFFSPADVDGPIAFFDSSFDFFNGEDDAFGYIEGTWDSASYSVVPVPAALWLFGSGLIGLIGIARRRQSV